MLAISGRPCSPATSSAAARDGPVLDGMGKLRDGWLDTGDLGPVDDDGFVHLAGRAKDLIIRGGHNIDPAVIEDALLAHPAVTAAAAVGRPTCTPARCRSRYVTLAAGAAVTAADELRDWAADRVAEQAAAPKAVTVLDALPVTAVGKPYKPALRAEATREAVADALAGMPCVAGVRGAVEDGAVVAVVEPDPRRRRDPRQASARPLRHHLEIGDCHDRQHRSSPALLVVAFAAAGSAKLARRARHARQGRARRLQRRGVPADRRARGPRRRRSAGRRVRPADRCAWPPPGCCCCSAAPWSPTCATATGRARSRRPSSWRLVTLAYLLLVVGALR